MFNRKLEYFIPSINDGTNKTHGIEDSIKFEFSLYSRKRNRNDYIEKY